MNSLPLRVGIGYDIHRLEVGRPFVLAGITIPAKSGPVGHSDGDLIFHAVSDAILGAVACEDIGHHFSDQDPANKNLASHIILERAISMAAQKGYRPAQIDLNLILEQPKIAPHRESLRKALAERCNLPLENVSVKARTHEGLDALGRGEAAACQAVVLISLAEEEDK